MTILEAVRKAISGKKWMTEAEIIAFVFYLTGKKISGSNATARCRELKADCRHLHNRRWEYHI